MQPVRPPVDALLSSYASDDSGSDAGLPDAPLNVTPLTLKLVSKKIPMKFTEYRISNTHAKMLPSDTMGISPLGVLFASAASFPRGALMRVWIEMPDYWVRKSRHVGYRHTDAPSYFQLLARVASCEETGKRNMKYQLLCQTVNLDPIDEVVLSDYLGLSSPATRQAAANQGAKGA